MRSFLVRVPFVFYWHSAQLRPNFVRWRSILDQGLWSRSKQRPLDDSGWNENGAWTRKEFVRVRNGIFTVIVQRIDQRHKILRGSIKTKK
jgi:hypothetical protein